MVGFSNSWDQSYSLSYLRSYFQNQDFKCFWILNGQISDPAVLRLDHTITEQILTISIPTNPVLCSSIHFCFNLSCFFRVDVDESHRVSRIVGPNRNGRQIKRTETSTYLFEYVGVTRVTPKPVFPALK